MTGMNIIKIGSRGPAVEDIQRRLTYLGYTLGSSGVDGVFLEDTAQAIALFQASVGLKPTREVDPYTWSQLVDSSFPFGDRMLYLRHPLYHGRDVEELQTALNSLGFMTGPIDGIFGPYTESAVIDFQNNMSIPADGVVGFETFDALNGFKHMWQGREVISHSAAKGSITNRHKALEKFALSISVASSRSLMIARRIQNLAVATLPDAEVEINNLNNGEDELSLDDKETSPLGRPVVSVFLRLDKPVLETEKSQVSTAAFVSAALPNVEFTFVKNVFSERIARQLKQDFSGLFLLSSAPKDDPLTTLDGLQNLAVYVLDSICSAVESLS